MNKEETEVVSSAGAHIGVAFGLFSRYLEATQDNPDFQLLNEAAVAWMRSTIDNILRTSSNVQTAIDNHHEEGYGAGV